MTLDYSSLPNSPEAERSVLGACIISQEALGTAIELLRPDDFYNVSYRTMFEILSSMYLSDKTVDMITLSEELKARELFESLGGQMFIGGLMSSVTTTANIITHSEIVRDYAVRRKLIEAGDRIISLSNRTDNETKNIIEEAERLIFEAAQNRSSKDFRHVREIIGPVFVGVEERYKENDNRVAGYPTGFPDLDSYMGGLQPGSLTIIAARPSMGKTAFAVNIAQFGGGSSNHPVLIFSLEMPAEQ
ncbi:MAG: replicative DNA helicase, partial [Synergistaceae bacterium]|nr:replicative DNA helicase [Synergistaceae bacterium]